MIAPEWDYLVVTAANDAQAAAYDEQLRLRHELGLIPHVRQILTLADPGGRRVGSGGSTIHCLFTILARELAGDAARMLRHDAWRATLAGLRILILHAGGDSRRLPAYSPCGKLFVPLPGESDRACGLTLFDRQVPVYLQLPPGAPGQGQVVIASGDVLLTFDPSHARFDRPGLIGLGCPAQPEVAQNHGVYCVDAAGRVRRFLQKPTPKEQSERQALSRRGETVLDIGVLSFDADAALQLLSLCAVDAAGASALRWAGPMANAIEARGLDFYREVCCALGSEATFEEYAPAVARAGSALDRQELTTVFDALAGMPFGLCLLPRCGFLHFGTTRQLISSGNDLLSIDRRSSYHEACLSINNTLGENGAIRGRNSWVEGCRIDAALTLGGENAVIGVDVTMPVALPPRAALDVLAGRTRRGAPAFFVRGYASHDVLHKCAETGGTLAGLPLSEWLTALGAHATDVWDASVPPAARCVWNGRFFPAAEKTEDHRAWLFLLDPRTVDDNQRRAWHAADRYSFEEMLQLADLAAFHRRRVWHRAKAIRQAGLHVFRAESELSARELAYVWQQLEEAERAQWFVELVRATYHECAQVAERDGLERLEVSRILHSLGTALEELDKRAPGSGERLLDVLAGALDPDERDWLAALDLTHTPGASVAAWTRSAQHAAFAHLGHVIVFSTQPAAQYPKSALRSDEIIWGRAPVRLDLAGGWTDTPPYALEHGGCVVNAAVTLNGQPPIHVYARVIPEPEVRLTSIDHGTRVLVTSLADLLDYREPTAHFGIIKAALALTGFSPAHATWPKGVATLPEMLRLFGGGLELTTLAAIPSGSGLGTSSIIGAVSMGVLGRLTGHAITPRELFNAVLQLEQELTTGGGWQDQVGGVVPGVKMITTEPGLVPDPRLHFLPSELIDPRANEGVTLLYYTGIRRLAKDILQTVVGNYLDRDRASMETLRQLRALPPEMATALSAKDGARFGRLIDLAWQLNKALDPDSTTPAIESILDSVRGQLLGAKLLGAGGGGFLLIVAKSPDDARALRQRLSTDPPNPRARFFDFAVAQEGLAITVS